MMNDELEGYSGKTRAILEKNKVKTWDKISLVNGEAEFEGILLPRNKFDAQGLVDLKLKNGYNIGVRVDDKSQFSVLGHEKSNYKIPERAVSKDKNKPDVTLVGTGGTVASRLDYVTGGVMPAFSPAELFSAVPELEEVANLDTVVKYEIFSEDATPAHWQELAKAVEEASKKKKDGVIIAHGTDTMGYSAAALSFMLPQLSIPVVFVGSQRSSDRPSSDAALNLLHATVAAATSNFAESVVCMMGSMDHAHAYLHKGVLVRKMHSSVRHTFKTIGTIPLAKVEGNNVTMLHEDYKRRGEDKKTVADTSIEEKVGIVYSYPGIDPGIIEHLTDSGYKGIVLAGTGLGHMPHATHPAIKRAIDEGIAVVMTVQTLWGYTGMDVYETGREQLALGVINGKNMIPEVAYSKLAWVLGHETDHEKVKKLMESNLRGEILAGEPPNGFQVFQGDA